MYGNNYGYYNPTRNIGVPQQPMNNQMYQQPIQTYQQPIVQQLPQSNIQGKIVDNVDVVKATDIPLDGSTSYFPLTDGSAIVTKKLGINGISEIQIYKPVVEDKKEEVKVNSNYLTIEDLDKRLEKLDNSELLDVLSDDIKNLTKEVKELKEKQRIKEK